MGSSQLQDKVILITGALGKAGRAAIPFFLERGASVAACDIKPASEFADQEQLQKLHGNNRLLYVEGDMTDEKQVQSLMNAIKQYFGRLDGCYHNVYVSRSKLISELSLDDWETAIRGTLTSAFLVCKYAAKLMKETGGGSIVNTSSIMGGAFVRPRSAGYSAGKAALEQLTRVAAAEFARDGIRVNAVVPGDFKTVETIERLGPNYMKDTTLIGRTGFPNEINAVAAFLLSDEASYVTGSMYPVDGGLVIQNRHESG